MYFSYLFDTQTASHISAHIQMYLFRTLSTLILFRQPVKWEPFLLKALLLQPRGVWLPVALLVWQPWGPPEMRFRSTNLAGSRGFGLVTGQSISPVLW